LGVTASDVTVILEEADVLGYTPEEIDRAAVVVVEVVIVVLVVAVGVAFSVVIVAVLIVGDVARTGEADTSPSCATLTWKTVCWKSSELSRISEASRVSSTMITISSCGRPGNKTS
jgi:hypothetical protein